MKMKKEDFEECYNEWNMKIKAVLDEGKNPSDSEWGNIVTGALGLIDFLTGEEHSDFQELILEESIEAWQEARTKKILLNKTEEYLREKIEIINRLEERVKVLEEEKEEAEETIEALLILTDREVY